MASNSPAHRCDLASPELKVLDSLKTSVFALDAQYRLQYMNPSAEALCSTAQHRAVGHTLEALFDQPKNLLGLCERAVELRGSVELRETKVVPLQYPEASITVDVTAIATEEGEVVLEIRNIENRLRIKHDKAMESQSSVSRTMIKQLAHEIKNPLGGLRGAAQLLSRRLPTPDLLEYTDIIISETDRLVHLVDAMLGPNRPTHRKAVNLHRVLDHVCKLITAEATGQVDVIRDFDPSLPRVLIDQDQMKQAVLNLARNALQAVGDSGQLIFRSRVEPGFTIGTHRHTTAVRIDIQDSGEGVPENLREKIFYPLVTGTEDGVGLGLVIAQELVQRHDGLIKLQPGKPTTFSIYLPMTVDKKSGNSNERL